MLAAVERAGVHLLVAHSQRYFASTVRARELIQNGSLGQPVFATDTWYKPFGVEGRLPWFLDRATGGGMWLMNGAHMIDRTCWVLDTEVASVRAFIGSPFHHLPVDDANMALLQLRNGLYATIVHAGYRARGVEKCEVEVTCSDGMLRFDSYLPNTVAVDDDAYRPTEVARVDPFAEELKNLIGAIRGREPLRATPSLVAAISTRSCSPPMSPCEPGREVKRSRPSPRKPSTRIASLASLRSSEGLKKSEKARSVLVKVFVGLLCG